ncbi:MAG: glycoside hydrolase, partial [Paludibacteraceae bacterium]|nr:glycoside hydrolase [Paludibacteraceae bacterium]
MRKLLLILLLSGPLVVFRTTAAEDVFQTDRARWLQTADSLKPDLLIHRYAPVDIVEAVRNDAFYQGIGYAPTSMTMQTLYQSDFKTVRSVTLDFGRHLTGHLRFHVKTLRRCQDAPVRLKFFFGELPAEMNTPLEPWPGTLSRAWMQDVTMDLFTMDTTYTIERRTACRYVRIELLGASNDFDFAIDHISFLAESAVDESTVKEPAMTHAGMKRIYRTGIRTLAECMQTVYEDGPKRDARLWLGDVYLESLANTYSFGRHDLTKRCLYLFAGLSEPDGHVLSNIFERPVPHAQTASRCISYSLLFNAALLEYAKATGDSATARDLYPVALHQMQWAMSYVDKNGLFSLGNNPEGIWVFFDWKDGIDQSTALQAAVIIALRHTLELGALTGDHTHDKFFARSIRQMSAASRKYLYDKKQQAFVSGQNNQLSVLSQVWMVLAGVVQGDEAARLLERSLADSSMVTLGTPYAT